MIAGDKGYSYPRVRKYLRDRGIRAVIPERSDQKRHRRGRPPKFDHVTYRSRSSVEQCVGWLKEHRAVGTRYDKTAIAYQGMIKLAMTSRYFRLLERN